MAKNYKSAAGAALTPLALSDLAGMFFAKEREDGRSDDRIAENLVLLTEAEIRSQDFCQINASRRSFFVIE